ncbi:hypothetical protein RQP46_011082 [Phenoliferia psychrophenolica]
MDIGADLATTWQPKLSIAECDAILTAPGSPFATARGLVDGRVLKYYADLPGGGTLKQFWQETIVHGDKDYIVYEEERLSYTQCQRITVQAANLFHAAGLVKGDRVALACQLIGAVPVAVNAWVSADQMAHCIDNSGAKLLVVDTERAEELSGKLSSGLRDVESVLLVRAATFPVQLPQRLALRYWTDVSKCAIYYTSGTTGMPRGVPATNRMFLTGIYNGLFGGARALLRRGEALPVPNPDDPQKAVLIIAPLFHVTGSQNQLPVATFMGAKIVLVYKFEVKNAIRLLKKEQITSYGGVPFLTRALIDAGVTEKDRLIEGFSFGGAPLAPSLVRDTAKAFPFMQWGMTEYFTIATTNVGEDFLARPRSCGIVNPVTELLIMDNPTGMEMPVGEVGEIWLRGVSGAKEYWRLPEATASSFTPDAWFKTGDLGYIDSEGQGFDHPAIKPNCDVTAAELHAVAAKNLKPMWRPRYILVQREEIVKNANGKLDKKLVRTQVQAAWAREKPKM